MELKPNPHAMQSGSIFPKGKVTVVNGFSNSRKEGIVKIWERCVKRWSSDHPFPNNETFPPEFFEMDAFICQLKKEL